MVSVKAKISWKTIGMTLGGIIGFLIFLFVLDVNIYEMIAIIQRIDIYVYSLAIIFLFFEVFFFALSWRVLLNFLSVRISLARSILYVWYSAFVDILIPAESISGEVSRLYLVTKEQPGVSGKVVASLVIQRIMGLSITVASLLIGTVILLINGQLQGLLFNLTVFLSVCATLLLVLLVFLCFRRGWTKKLIGSITRFLEFISRKKWKLDKVRSEGIKIADTFHDAIRQFRKSPKDLLFSAILFISYWFFSIGILYLVFVAIGSPLHWSIIIVTYSIINAIRAIPIGIPFEAGIPEITMATLFTILGVPKDVSSVATVLIRILTLWLRFLIGFVAQQWVGIKILPKKE